MSGFASFVCDYLVALFAVFIASSWVLVLTGIHTFSVLGFTVWCLVAPFVWMFVAEATE